MKIAYPQWLALSVCLALVAACGSPGYNDNPSQQISDAKLGCPAATEFFAVYFSIRVQPPSENQDATLTRQQFRSYCNDLPSPGKVFFIADLVGNELRDTPLAVRVAEQEFTGLDASRAENFQDLRTLAELAAKTYANGVIEASFDVDKPGYYAVYISRGREAAEQDSLRIPLNIGVDADARLLGTRLAGLLGVAGLAFVGHWALGRRRKRP